MKATTGYYSIIQFCPDPARREVANVGVVLLCPELGFLKTRMAEGTHRIKEVFPKLRPDPKRLASELRLVERRLDIDREYFKTVDDLTRFAETRANAMRLTLPLPIRIEQPEAELSRLFARLVGERERQPRNRIRRALAETFKKWALTDRIQENVRVTLPLFDRSIKAPFGFQNGRFNLIQATKFAGHKMAGILPRAGQFALEGELLTRQPHPKLGPMQLVVVAQFGADQDDVFEAVRSIFQEKQTRLYTLDEADRLAEEIRQTAKPLDPSLFVH
ncbi:MAG TPA: DUF3037 domain-containing protein [Gemmataceae bacterium]|jgi:hypothetical protein